MKDTELVSGALGTILGTAGTVMQTDEILRVISLIITIIGGVITWIVIPLLNWHKKAKADGKITADELKEGFDTLQEGINQINVHTDKKENDENGK